MTSQPIGQLLDTLGVTADLDDGDMPVDALVLLKVVKADGEVSLVKGSSESLDWILSLGMLTAGIEIDRGGFTKLIEESDG